MDDCPACTGSLRHKGKLHCTSTNCPWLVCGTCGATVDADTACYWEPKQLIWGNPDRYLKGGESVCQPPNTPKPSETKPSPSTTQTDQPQ